MHAKLHEPKQLDNQIPGGRVQIPGRGQFMLRVEQRIIKKTNPGKAQVFLRSHLKMYMTVFLLLLCKQSKADS